MKLKMKQKPMLVNYLVPLLGLFASIPGADAYVVSDNRVNSLDITPTLGRGYSIMTNTYQSLCLNVEETTVPSYNYDYSFYDFSNSQSSTSSKTTVKLDITRKFFFSFGFSGLIAEVENRKSQDASSLRYMASSMRIERYYSSVKEDVSALFPDAAALLDRQDYIGFFKACGPTYIRGIRRAQEVVAYIIFSTTNSSGSQSYADGLKYVNMWGRSNAGTRKVTTKTNFNYESQSTTIIIKGWGMGLTQEGSETLVATNFDEYEEVMHFAFTSMTRNDDSVHIGMVYGMEVIPWVENTSFQVRSQVNDQVIQIPLVRSLIPQADASGNCIQGYEKDKFGYCCEAEALYDPIERQYDAQLSLQDRVCRPLRLIDPAVMKSNMAANGEFVARLDRSLRYKLNQMNTLEKCISVSRAIPEKYDFFVLKRADTVKVDSEPVQTSLFELKMALDPFQDYSLLSHMGKELDEWAEKFIQPCYAALFGTDSGFTPDTDVTYLMAYPWYSHDICTKLSCLGNNMRWDRSNNSGGCVSSLIAGSSATELNLNTDSDNCKKAVDDSGSLVCKHSTITMLGQVERYKKCWSKALPDSYKIDFMIKSYCMPQLTEQSIDAKAQQSLILSEKQNCRKNSPLQNVALLKPAKQSKYKAGYEAFNGNDGYKNSLYNIAVAQLNSGISWWEVDLEDQYKIRKIIIHNRGDCCFSSIEEVQIILKDKDDNEISVTNPPRIVAGSARLKNELVFEEPPLNVQKVRLQSTKEIGFTEVEVMAHVLQENPWLEGKLFPGDSVYSKDFTKELTFKGGNLVLREVKENASSRRRLTTDGDLWSSEWSSSENTDEAAFATMMDGSLIIVDVNGKTKWSSETSGSGGSVLKIDDDDTSLGIYASKDEGAPSLWSSKIHSSIPSMKPSLAPSIQPSLQPSSKPSSTPTLQPSLEPSEKPSIEPSLQPSEKPNMQPSQVPSISIEPSLKPSLTPSDNPSLSPSDNPSLTPSSQPSLQPSYKPSSMPSLQPSSEPSKSPSSEPSLKPSLTPSLEPSSQPSIPPFKFLDRTELNFALNDYCLNQSLWVEGYDNYDRYGAIELWDVSYLTDMSNLFSGTGTVNCNVDISQWDVSNVINFNGMFGTNKVFNADISNWNVSSGVDFGGMFMNSQSPTAFNQNLSSWNVSKGTNFASMFDGSRRFESDLSNWDVSKGTTFSRMFYRASKFNGDVSAWNVSSSTDFEAMFQMAIVFNQNISGWNVSAGINFDSMFFRALVFNQNISDWNISSGTTFDSMFYYARAFDQDLGWALPAGSTSSGFSSSARCASTNCGVNTA